MKTMGSQSLDDFYKEAALHKGGITGNLLPSGLTKEIGHFNVFDVAKTIEDVKQKAVMPYNRRAYYKISLVRGKNRAEYADKIFEIDTNTLLFATPRVPYNWQPIGGDVSGSFCIFTGEFMTKSKSGIELDDLPIFQAGGYPVFQISDEDSKEMAALFKKMQKEIASDYAYKYDLARNYVMELIHYGQKLQPAAVAHSGLNASARVTALFIELLERQFPIESPEQKLALRTAKDYADRLAIHVNHLNKVLKTSTGKTTTDFIGSRIAQEAKILLRHTNWNVSEIAYSLGFEEVAHFSNFFKKQTALAPIAFRS